MLQLEQLLSFSSITINCDYVKWEIPTTNRHLFLYRINYQQMLVHKNPVLLRQLNRSHSRDGPGPRSTHQSGWLMGHALIAEWIWLRHTLAWRSDAMLRLGEQSRPRVIISPVSCSAGCRFEEQTYFASSSSLTPVSIGPKLASSG